MKNIIFALTLFAISSSSAYSEEVEPELMEASQEYAVDLLITCKGYAQADEVALTDMNAYLLTCVNDELEQSYYKRIQLLPKET